VRHWLWRIPLIAAMAAFLLGAVLVAAGQRYVSDLVVGTGFVIGLVAVPLWVFTAPGEDT
jgi:hypothetical protein